MGPNMVSRTGAPASLSLLTGSGWRKNLLSGDSCSQLKSGAGCAIGGASANWLRASNWSQAKLSLAGSAACPSACPSSKAACCRASSTNTRAASRLAISCVCLRERCPRQLAWMAMADRSFECANVTACRTEACKYRPATALAKAVYPARPSCGSVSGSGRGTTLPLPRLCRPWRVSPWANRSVRSMMYRRPRIDLLTCHF